MSFCGCPAINISWENAQLYVIWLSSVTGKKYRLLSEAEWEYAARAGSTNDSSGNSASANIDHVRGRTSPVGSYNPNNFGLFDMDGNVREWVEDSYINHYVDAPNDGTAATVQNFLKVWRGCSWDFNTPCRFAHRSAFTKSWKFDVLGFRVARDIKK